MERMFSVTKEPAISHYLTSYCMNSLVMVSCQSYIHTARQQTLLTAIKSVKIKSLILQNL
jgi:hypothetical protein